MKRQSFVWNYFNKENNKVSCKLCKHVFQFNHSTSTMRYHLFTLHHLKDPSQEGQQSIKQFALSLPHTVKEKTDKAAFWYVVCDLHPLSAVEGEGLEKFLRQLNPAYKPPCRQTIRKLLDSEYARAKKQVRMSSFANWLKVLFSFVEKLLKQTHM